MKPTLLVAVAALAALAPACTAPEEAAPAPAAGAAQAGPVLVRSSPAASATVASPDELVLVFDRPVALAELMVEGPDGAMPMMLSPAGEQVRYRLPLHGLGPGAYRVRWRTGGAAPGAGAFRFTVR